MAKWKKPSGQKIETSDGEVTIEHCQSLGWERLDDLVSDDLVADDLVEDELVEDDPEPENDPE